MIRRWISNSRLATTRSMKLMGIWNIAVYAKESAGHILELYHLVLWKSYLEEKNTWEPVLAIQHLWKLVTAYHKGNLEKLIAISAPVNTAPPMAMPSAPPRPTPITDIPIKRKRGQSAGLMAALTKKRGQLAKSTTTTTNKWAKTS